jgi:hypothetical protein
LALDHPYFNFSISNLVNRTHTEKDATYSGRTIPICGS